MHNTQDSWESLYRLSEEDIRVIRTTFFKCFEIPTFRANIKRVQIQICVDHNTK